jgi:hypothetical protein|tara:strand:+ start:246 stop:545 length:300 start_codon:yes stop_codon:yes gene_type:complete
MSKRGPLSKIEKFYIENNTEKNVDDIALDLDRAKSVVKAYADKNQKKPTKKEPTHAASQIPSSRGSTVMTENGSSLGDDFRTKSKQLGKRSECTTSTRV